jgi:hypothetical protein
VTHQCTQSQRISMNAAQAIAKLENAFSAHIPETEAKSSRLATWTCAYLPYLKKLEAMAGDLPLEADLLIRVLRSYPEGTRSRQVCGLVLGMLARSTGVQLPKDWDETSSGYKAKSKSERAVASDKLILDCAEKIKSPEWKRVYGLMAIYGLRNYEAFFCDFAGLSQGDGFSLVVMGIERSQARIVTPCPVDWLSIFDITALREDCRALPAVQTCLAKTTLQRIGQRTSEQFRRYDLPLTPVDLRHAWAVRSITSGMPPTLGARMLGVDISQHVDRYRSWIEERDNLFLVSQGIPVEPPTTEIPF